MVCFFFHVTGTYQSRAMFVCFVPFLLTQHAREYVFCVTPWLVTHSNRPDVRGILRGEGWVVKEGMAGVQMAVNRAHAEMDTGMPSMVEVMPKPWPTPPTHFKLNAFTIAFQVCSMSTAMLKFVFMFF